MWFYNDPKDVWHQVSNRSAPHDYRMARRDGKSWATLLITDCGVAFFFWWEVQGGGTWDQRTTGWNPDPGTFSFSPPGNQVCPKCST